jgi:hypothetical protein
LTWSLQVSINRQISLHLLKAKCISRSIHDFYFFMTLPRCRCLNDWESVNARELLIALIYGITNHVNLQQMQEQYFYKPAFVIAISGS